MSAQHIELARLALRGLSERDRQALIKELSGQTSEPPPERLLRRAEVAALLSCSLRLVDLLSRQGALTRIKLPGRKRGNGFLESQVAALIAGGGTK